MWWGLQAFLVVSMALAVAASVPALRGLFDDDRVDVDAGSMLWRALVVIPLATVVMEELAFRGVLLGLLRRIVDDRRAVRRGRRAVRPVARAAGALDDGTAR